MGTLKVNGDISATGSISASSFLGNASSATTARFLSSHDTRYDSIEPNQMKANEAVQFDFKAASTIGLTDAPYSGVMSYRPYSSDSDWSGGPAHQLAFNNAGLYWRQSSGNSWLSWNKLIHSGNYTDYTVTKTGSGASGTWGINISGNAATASKWATGRTFTIGGTAKSVDGSSNVSWSIDEIGVPYVYHTGPGFSAYGNWGMMISSTRNTYGESGKADNYYIATDASNNLRTGHQLNGTANITWTDILNEHNYSSYALPLSGGTMSGSPVIKFPASAGSIATSDPMAITYGRISAYGTLCINADTDVSGGEYIILTAGKGLSSSIADGLAIGQSTLTWQGSSIITSGNIGSQSVAWADVAGNASYLTMLGGTTTASVRNYDSNVSLATGGWADANAGYGYTWGTTLDVSGYSTWYHRLAFRTDGHIEYWHGINTKTMSKVGILLTSANYTSYCAPASHSHNYATLGAPNNLMHSGNEFTFVPAGYSGGVWFNYRTVGWETNGNISQYTFGNGRGGAAPIEYLYDITHNYGAYDPNSQSPPGTGVQGAIFYQI